MLRKLLLALALLVCASAAEAANRFAVCTTTCTWDASDTSMWSTTSGGGTGASVPGTGDAVVFDAATCVGGTTCTVTVNVTVAVQSITMGACTASTNGCILDFDTNDNNITLSAQTGMSCSGTGTRTLSMGSGTWTFNSGAAGTIWSCATVTNMTCNCSAATMVMGATGVTGLQTFSGGGLTGANKYGTLSIGANSSLGTFSITGANQFVGLSIAAPNYVTLPNAATTIIDTAPTFTGGSVSSLRTLISNSTAVATISIASGTMSSTWTAFRQITCSGGATYAATDSFDLGITTTCNITAPTVGGGGGRCIGC